MIRIYTDGGCSGNPGPGAWATIILSEKKDPVELSDSEMNTTNNRMELTAVIRALEYIGETDTQIEVFTDSEYVQKGISQWMENWIKRGWKTASGSPVKNKDLWMHLKEKSDVFSIQWNWVRGHAGNEWNERCDKLVGIQINTLKHKSSKENPTKVHKVKKIHQVASIKDKMDVLGIETSCDECGIAVVRNGKEILANTVASQVERHAPWNGVVPEIASRLHVEWIDAVCEQALSQAGLSLRDIDAVAVTSQPGLIGSLLVGLSYAKGLAWASGKPWVSVDHIKAHLYASHMEQSIEYPYVGLIVSGGHTILCRVNAPDEIDILGTTIDDACGEAFDKVAKYYDMGYPGGVFLDKLAEEGDDTAFRFPFPQLHKGEHRYDVSYSGLKTAAVNQLEKFRTEGAKISKENIAASFRKAAIDMLLDKVKLAVRDTGLRRLVLGGGVSANRYLRRMLGNFSDIETFIPSLPLCADNGAMIAGLAYHYLIRGERATLSMNASARVSGFRRNYP